MTIEETSKATKRFLKKLDEKKIYKFNRKLWNEKKDDIQNTTERLGTFTHHFEKIYNCILDNVNIPNEDKPTLIMQMQVWIIASYLELIKNFLIIIIDAKYCKFNSEIVTYGKLIRILCKALGYDETLRKATLDNFFVDFRNAIFHNKYKFNENGMTYENYDKKIISLSFEQLGERTRETTAFFDSITSFVNDKTDELESNRKRE